MDHQEISPASHSALPDPLCHPLCSFLCLCLSLPLSLPFHVSRSMGNGEKEPGSTCCGEFSGLGASGHSGMVCSSPQTLWGRSSGGEAGPCLTGHPQPQRGLLEHGTISEVAVEHPIIKSIDVVYSYCSWALGQPGPHKGHPSPISLHLLFLHVYAVLPFIVYVHCWGELFPVPLQLHVLDADIQGQLAWELHVLPQNSLARPEDSEIHFP